MTCPDDDTLAAIATLPESERAAIADHAASCATCRGLVQDLLGVAPAFAEAETLAASAAPAPEIPTVIDRYRIDRRIGAGAMGVVYAGFDPELARPVAVKVLRAGGSADRMRREAQALAKLTDPHVVAVYDVGEHAGSTFVTMALVDGENLRTWLQTPRSTGEVVAAIVQAARGVEAAHRAGIVHRDIKPDNIFVARDGSVLVGDFGLARSGGEAADRDAPVSELTQTGALVGTPAYMAPEQVDGDASAASDQFALCVTAWEALYGKRPFTGQTIGELVAAMRRGPPPEPRGRKIPAHVRSAIRRGLAADPAARHTSLAELIAALTPRRRWWPYVAAAGALAAGAAIVVVATREDPEARCDRIVEPARWASPADVKPALASALATTQTRYAAAWTQLAKTSCVAAAKRELSEPIYAATRRCLDRRAAVFTWLGTQQLPPLELLGVAESLEPVESCKQAIVGTPSAALATLHGELDRAAPFVHYAPDKARDVEALLVRAIELGDPPTVAEASYLVALSLNARGRDPEKALRSALAAAEQARDDRIRTRTSALLAAFAARVGRIGEATTHRELATSAAARVDDPLTALAVERANVAIAFARRDFKTEIAAHRRIVALELARFGEGSLAVLNARFALGSALQRDSDPEGKPLIAAQIDALAKLSDQTLAMQLEHAVMHERAPSAKIPLQERLIALARRDDPAKLPALLRTIGYDYELTGDFERALESAREALGHPISDEALKAELVENAANFAFELADLTDDKPTRDARIADALAYIDQLPADLRDSDAVQVLRGRTLLLAGRYLEAIPYLTAGLAAAEKAEPQHPYRIMMRSFALAQALWEVGGTRDRDRARALADQAAARIPDARKLYEADREAYGAQLDRLERHVARLEAWRRTHR